MSRRRDTERDPNPAFTHGVAAGEQRLHEGERVAGRYTVRGRLGIGGLAEVYDAWDELERAPWRSRWCAGIAGQTVCSRGRSSSRDGG